MDTDYIKKVYTENAPAIYRYFLYRVKDNEIAVDLTSETFLRFIANKENDIGNIKGYLFGIAILKFPEIAIDSISFIN